MVFLTKKETDKIEGNFSSPCYVYSQKILEENAEQLLNFPSAFGHTVRYAMKANANLNILKIFKNKKIKIDASSEYEAYRAISAGFDANDIQVSWQETPKKLKDLIEKWIFFVATSLKQIEEVWKIFTKNNSQNREIWIRINPWVWSWAFKSISTWWTTSAFGIWHEYTEKIQELAEKYKLKITKLHFHIWSENTPESWANSAEIGFKFIEKFPDIEIFDMWGGFKKAIMPYEKTTDLKSVWLSVAKTFEEFYKKTGRKIHLEIEPGKYLVINSCNMYAKIDDIVDTGKDGYTFIRTNTGMTELPRTPMYWVQQEIVIINSETEEREYVVVGHCCESWDLLTCKLYEQEEIETRKLNKANIWDSIIIWWVGAYNSSMSMKNYNSFPEAAEILILNSWEIKEIRKRQKLEDIWKNEINVID